MNKFCPNCGKELKEGAEVCLNCGKRVVETGVVPKQDNSTKIILLVVGLVVGIPMVIIILAIVIPLIVYNSVSSSSPRRDCCIEAGGTWNESYCSSGGNYWYDSDDYNACVDSYYDY